MNVSRVVTLFLSLVLLSQAQQLKFNSSFINSCMDTSCDIMNASLWSPPRLPSSATSLLINTPSVFLSLNSSLSVQGVTIANASFLSVIETGEVYFQNFVVSGSYFYSYANFTTGFIQISDSSRVDFYSDSLVTGPALLDSSSTLELMGGNVRLEGDSILGTVTCNLGATLSCPNQCVISSSLVVTCSAVSFGSLVLSAGSVMNVTVDTLVAITSSFVSHSASSSYFGGGFGQEYIPIMEVGPGATVTVQRLLNVRNLSVADAGILELVGGGYTSVAQLEGNGTIFLSESKMIIGESVFNGIIRAVQSSTIILSGFAVNGSLLTDSSSSLVTSEQGIQLLAPATLHGGFANSATLSIAPSGSLFVSGVLALQAKSVLELNGITILGNVPITVNGSVTLDGQLKVTLANWLYNGSIQFYFLLLK